MRRPAVAGTARVAGAGVAAAGEVAVHVAAHVAGRGVTAARIVPAGSGIIVRTRAGITTRHGGRHAT